MFTDFLIAVKSRANAAIQFSIWIAVAGVLALVAVGFFVAALHTWLAQWYGSIEASLMIGGGLLAIALVLIAIAAVIKRRAANRMRLQQQRLQQRLSVQPMTLVTTLAAQLIGPKQTTALMLIALAAGFFMGRPRRPSSARD